MNMKNKKGFLLGEFTLKTIIAVLSLALLIYLLVSLYGIFQGDEDLEKAEDLLKEIILKLGTTLPTVGTYDMILIEPKGTLAYFPDGQSGADCARNCFCIEVDRGLLKKNDYVCKYADSIVLEEPIKIDGPTDIRITFKKEGYEFVFEKI
jgi:hypothetical protein